MLPRINTCHTLTLGALDEARQQPEMAALFAFIDAHYGVDAALSERSPDWTVYRYED